VNRRKFLGMLGLAPAVPALLKGVPATPYDLSEAWTYDPSKVVPNPGGYCDYTTFSDWCTRTAIDPVVLQAAHELTLCKNPQHIHDWASGDDCLA
jgi:hypothetical protein